MSKSINEIHETDSLNVGRKKINNAIKAFNETVVEGDSSVEAAQARVDEKGQTHSTLKDRIDDGFIKVNSQLAERVTHSELDSWIATVLDGGPSIFYETLSALEADYPNGAAGVALVSETDPARIYVWNPIEKYWQDFGAYQGIEIKNNTVTPEKTTFISKSTNLLDLSGGQENTTVRSSTGEPIDEKGSYLTKFIPMTPRQITFYGIRSIAMYDADKNFLGVTGTGIPTDTVTRNLVDNTSFIRAVVFSDYKNVAQINEGDKLLSYEPFREMTLSDSIQTTNVKKGILEPDHLIGEYGEKLAALLDSMEKDGEDWMLSINKRKALVEEHSSSIGGDLLSGEERVYGVYDVTAYDTLSIFVSLSTSADLEIRIQWLDSNNNGYTFATETITNSVVGSTHLIRSIISPKFRLIVKNNENETIRVGLGIYAQ